MFCYVDRVELALPPRNNEIFHISTSASSYAYANYVSVFKNCYPLFFYIGWAQSCSKLQNFATITKHCIILSNYTELMWNLPVLIIKQLT